MIPYFIPLPTSCDSWTLTNSWVNELKFRLACWGCICAYVPFLECYWPRRPLGSVVLVYQGCCWNESVTEAAWSRPCWLRCESECCIGSLGEPWDLLCLVNRSLGSVTDNNGVNPKPTKKKRIVLEWWRNDIIWGLDDITALLYLWWGFHVVCLASGTQSTDMLQGDRSCPDGPSPAPDCCEGCWQLTPLTQMQSGPDLLHKTRLKPCKFRWQIRTCLLAFAACKNQSVKLVKCPKTLKSMSLYAEKMTVFPVSVIQKLKALPVWNAPVCPAMTMGCMMSRKSLSRTWWRKSTSGSSLEEDSEMMLSFSSCSNMFSEIFSSPTRMGNVVLPSRAWHRVKKRSRWLSCD